MIKFEDELRDAAEKKDAFVVLDYLLPEVQALPVVQEFEAGTLNLPGAGAFRMQDADAEALTEAILACKLMVRRLELPNHAIGNAGAGQLAKLLTVSKQEAKQRQRTCIFLRVYFGRDVHASCVFCLCVCRAMMIIRHRSRR